MEFSPLVQKYFKLWDNLQQAYLRLRAKLQHNHQAYTGMAFRMVAENIDQILQQSTCLQYIFVGLNAVTRAEETIIRRLLEQKKAEVLFDSDDF